MWFAGSTLRVALTDAFYLAGRGAVAANASDWAGDDNLLTRIQAGIGVRFFERALLKLEFVTQSEGNDSPGQIGGSWLGGLAELSVGF